jgi:DNA-binding transcriptional LysR family regulator
MEMHQIRYFLAAAKALSFTRAAEVSNVSQPALTAAMKKLEAELGGPLFYREANRLMLTDFGRQMEPLLAQITERADAATTAAENLRLLNQPPVRLGVMPTLGPAFFSRFLFDFQRACPSIELSISEGAPSALAADLEADRLDVALLNPHEQPAESFRIEPLYTERYVVVLPPGNGLREANAIALNDLDQQPYVDRLACEMREMVMNVCGQLGVKLYARLRSEREDWVQAMVAEGVGFAFMPEHSITNPGVIQRPLVAPNVQRTIALMTKPGRPHSPAVEGFLRAARIRRWTV